MSEPARLTSAERQEAELCGKRVRYHGSKPALHGEHWTVRGCCHLFDECDDDPKNTNGECGYEWGLRWQLIGREIGGGRRELIIHVRPESFTVLE